MDTHPLSPELTHTILARWGLAAASPTVPFLHQLITAYARHVPWETASRLGQRTNIPTWQDCARLGEPFWQAHLAQGTGGTCFESNYAFFSLLRALGYEGYLTINNMGEMIGCHTAIVLTIEGEKWLADVGIPLYVPLRVAAAAAQHHPSDYHLYTITPLGDNQYQIERSHHPKPIIFTLIDEPVSDARYRQATINDYGPEGLFLNRLILTKLIGAYAWLYNPWETADHLIYFRQGQRGEIPLPTERAATLAAHFQMDVQVIQQALGLLDLPDGS
ncbi:MAG: arylamine N-acetyltransferase [Anaerolineae bacterium]|nr:arylamine N-acetyltransferase [Anaerolineae bacterium]